MAVRPKPLIIKQNGRWVAWMPVQVAHPARAIKVAFTTWAQAIQAVGTWHKAQRTDAIAPDLIQKSRREMSPTPKLNQNVINHVVLVLDASSSMEHLKQSVIKVGDDLVKFLAKRSQEMNQETRITLYTFADEPACVVYDTDVLRLPSLATLYKPYGNTALIDATCLALDDLALTPEKYGDHAFLVYIVTDGEENASGRSRTAYGYSSAYSSSIRYGTSPTLVQKLSTKIKGLPGNWTVAALVPNSKGKILATDYGFPKGNVEIWDASSSAGMEETGSRIQAATASYMTARASGTRSTTSLFDIGANVVNAQAILDAGLKPLDYDDYDLVPVGVWPGQAKPDDYDEKKRRKPWKAHGGRIDEFVQNVRGGQYIIGQGYYQLMEGTAVRVQASKKIAIVHKKTERAYTGEGARKLLGLPDNMEVRIKPSASDDYMVFVQSKAANRLLIPGSKLLIFKK